MNTKSITAGFAIFCMFFGAGNIVLPLYLVQSWPGDVLSSFAGFCITGVLVPLLGLIAAILCTRVSTYFAPLGAFFALMIQIILISIEGPFGVVPRSMIVSHGSFIQEFPDFTGIFFYIPFCLLLYFLAVKERGMVNIIGKYLTPIMLLFLAVLFFTANYDNDTVLSTSYSQVAFLDGLYKGYLTYDLPAAIYFTSIAMSYFRSDQKTNDNLIKNGLVAGGIAIILLVFVYAIFIYLGMANYNLIKEIQPEQILPAIVRGSLGSGTSLIFTFFILLACLSTAVAAISVWTDFLQKILFKNINISREILLSISLIISVAVAEMQFKGLIAMLQPVLQIVYPILILLTIYNIFKHCKIMPVAPNNSESAKIKS